MLTSSSSSSCPFYFLFSNVYTPTYNASYFNRLYFFIGSTDRTTDAPCCSSSTVEYTESYRIYRKLQNILQSLHSGIYRKLHNIQKRQTQSTSCRLSSRHLTGQKSFSKFYMTEMFIDVFIKARSTIVTILIRINGVCVIIYHVRNLRSNITFRSKPLTPKRFIRFRSREYSLYAFHRVHIISHQHQSRGFS